MLKAMQKFGFSTILILGPGVAIGETVTGGDFYEDRSEVEPCVATLNTDAGKSITLQLVDHKDAWSLHFVISDRASVYRRFLDSRGRPDVGAFEGAFGGVRIGTRSFDFHDTDLFSSGIATTATRGTAGIFILKEKHNVARALAAMSDDGIEVQGLVSLDGTATVLSEFRSCSYAAMGLQEGERVETDFRAEYRMIFEDAFEFWVTSMARAEHCYAARFDNDAVSEVIDAAAEAFYPGILNFFKRSEYRKNLEVALPIAKLSGMMVADSEGCDMAGRLAEVSRMPVDKAIDEAASLD